MANEITIYSVCKACVGTGIDRHSITDGEGNITWVEQDCAACSATGKVSLGALSGGALDDIIDKLNDIFERVSG